MSIEIEGPYSFKDVDGLVAPVYIFEPGGEKKTVGKVAVKVRGGMNFSVELDEEYKDLDSASFEVPMRFTYLADPKEHVNWGYNCLTNGVHHGRPEAIWNVTLIQTTHMFTIDELRELVGARIYNDAVQLFEHAKPGYAKEWAEQVRDVAMDDFIDLYSAKLQELHDYYSSSIWRRDVQGVIDRVREDKLNTHYQPVHGHDSINMLCRMLGQGALYKVTKP